MRFSTLTLITHNNDDSILSGGRSTSSVRIGTGILIMYDASCLVMSKPNLSAKLTWLKKRSVTERCIFI